MADPDRKGAADRVLSRVARNAMRELATRPGRTVATVLLALAVTQAALSRRRVSQPSVRPDPDLQGKIAAAGVLGALYLVLLSGCGTPPPRTVVISPDPATVRYARSSRLVEPGENPARQDRIGYEAVHADAGLHNAVVLDRFLIAGTTNKVSDQRLAGPRMVHGKRSGCDFRMPTAMSPVAGTRTLAMHGHAALSLASKDPEAAWLPYQVRGVAELAC